MIENASCYRDWLRQGLHVRGIRKKQFPTYSIHFLTKEVRFDRLHVLIKQLNKVEATSTRADVIMADSSNSNFIAQQCT